MQASLKLFGIPRIDSGDSERFINANRSLLLCAYLTVQGDWVRRDELLTLFWPEFHESKARKNLRTLLYKTKKEADFKGLQYDDHQVRFIISTDVQAFQEEISKANWTNALKIYKDEFLKTYKGNESAAFDDWLEQTREELSITWRQAIVTRAKQLLGENKAKETILLVKQALTRKI